MGSEFSSQNPNAEHGQSHWQVTTYQNGFDNPVAESWKNFENWYYDIDSQAGDNLSDEEIGGLDEFTTYLWRVRYRDKEMNWSEWSNPVEFSTGASILPPNLLANPGAEDDINGWTVVEGVFEALEASVCNGVLPYSGNKYFAVGGLCDHSEIGRAVQNIDLSAYVDSIDAGGFLVNFGGYLSNYSGSDLPEMRVIFLDENMVETGQSDVLFTLNNTWTSVSTSDTIPAQTRHIQVELKGTRNAGTDNDSYFDDLFLSVGSPNQGCDIMTSVTNFQPSDIQALEIFPNPARDIAKIRIPENLSEDFILGLANGEGHKIQPIYQKGSNEITINIANLPEGVYIVWLRGRQRTIFSAKIIVV